MPSGIPLIDRAASFGDRPAIVATDGAAGYDELLDASSRVAGALLEERPDLEETRVAFLAPPGLAWVATWWGIWRAGGIAVPLCTAHPRPELDGAIVDCGAEVLVAHPALEPRLRAIAESRGRRLLSTRELLAAPRRTSLPGIDAGRRALIVYTSGTTGRPKGAVTTHANLAAQIESLVEAWEWTADDRIPLVLPLHHVHGIVNVLACALWSGAVCEMPPGFDAAAVWERLGSGEPTLFMAVPTVYAKLVTAWEALPAGRQGAIAGACRRMRLMVSGSAALPVQLLERWRRIAGHTLLERYGMTETGMILSNPLHGERRPGHVGQPLPGVEVRRIGADGRPAPAESPAELQVRGPGVFREYWRRPQETAAAFDGGWFRTGDVAVVEDGSYRLLGRSSVDILKTGGYKVSALEIEAVLRHHPAIAECAVVGLADPEWGQRVAAAVVLRPGQALDLDALRAWTRERLAVYKAPTRLRIVDDLPRNALGKVVKPQVAELWGEAG